MKVCTDHQVISAIGEHYGQYSMQMSRRYSSTGLLSNLRQHPGVRHEQGA